MILYRGGMYWNRLLLLTALYSSLAPAFCCLTLPRMHWNGDGPSLTINWFSSGNCTLSHHHFKGLSSGRGDATRWFKGENDKVSTPQTLAPFLTIQSEWTQCLLYCGNNIRREKLFFLFLNPDKEDYWEAL